MAFYWETEAEVEKNRPADGLVLSVKADAGNSVKLTDTSRRVVGNIAEDAGAAPNAADALAEKIEKQASLVSTRLRKRGGQAVLLGLDQELASAKQEVAPGAKCLERVAVVNAIGKETNKYHTEGGDGFGGELHRDLVRRGAAAAARSLREHGASTVGFAPLVESASLSSRDAHEAAAEGARLGLFRFNELKQSERAPTDNAREKEDDSDTDDAGPAPKRLSLFPVSSDRGASESDSEAWTIGQVAADCQDVARRLAICPANLMNPRLLVENATTAVKHFSSDDSTVEVRVRDEDWIAQQRMGCFQAVTQGSDEPPRFLELRYHGRDAVPGDDATRDYDYLLVGKGVTFDAGGISIKPAANMGAMKGDMGGAAAVIAAFCGVAKLQPAGLRMAAIVPMCENMISGRAIKPGDVAISRKGLSVEIDNTDAEGRLILADALDYGCERYAPRRVIDVATLTGAIAIALGNHAAGAFVHGDELWEDLQRTGNLTGERLWRMPIFDEHREMMNSDVADLQNAGARGAGSSTAAAFLRDFVDLRHVHEWAHLDVAGVDFSNSVSGYHTKGMTGIPTRTLLKLLCNHQ